MMTQEQKEKYPTLDSELQRLALKRLLMFVLKLRTKQIKMIKHGKIKVLNHRPIKR